MVATEDLVVDEVSTDADRQDDDGNDDEDAGSGHQGSPQGGIVRARQGEPSHRFLRAT